jgi:hypothetical protein
LNDALEVDHLEDIDICLSPLHTGCLPPKWTGR